jgi:hypothetical protein
VLVPILKAASTPDDVLTWAAFHTFRHTFATLLVDAGANVKRVSKMLGHHKASFTLDYYTHLFEDDLGPAINVSALVAEGAGRGQVEVSQPSETTRNARDVETRALQQERGLRVS